MSAADQMDDLMQPVAYLDDGLGAFYWPQEYKKDVGFKALYTADQMREYARKAVEAEREACAKVCDEYAASLDGDKYYWDSVSRDLAQSIRARR